MMMTEPGYQWTLTIPQHGELGPGLLGKLIRQAGLTTEEFNNL
jgi:predicted RNA binding protein YcfA (HicA-like mRNA interferase family)